MALIEKDEFAFDFLSRVAERESWRKEIHRPIYHVHKWWAKRLGSVFRGILLGAVMKEGDLADAFYRSHAFDKLVVFDPFMGSGTTVGEAHKLGLTALGRDINPVATESVQVALGPLDKTRLQRALVDLLDSVGERIQSLYKSTDSEGRICDVLYYFWVMQSCCPSCRTSIDLFPSYVVASNAYPQRKPEVHVLCPSCGDIFRAPHRHGTVTCRSCQSSFEPDTGRAKGAKASCTSCDTEFPILDSVRGQRPSYRLYAKLVLTDRGLKEYLKATDEDQRLYDDCTRQLDVAVREGKLELPTLRLEHGYNTRQAIGYGFRSWQDFFNDRQLLALGLLRQAIGEIKDEPTRRAMLVLFSGVLEFNNLFTSYKGEGTGAVRHMFAHHILKPERIPIEANVWGTAKSSGSFTGLFKSRLLRAIDYRQAPVEVNGATEAGRVCAPPFTGRVEGVWPVTGEFAPRGIYVSTGDSSDTALPESSVDLVVTDPPFFDNVHYSELADFFFAWQSQSVKGKLTTRHAGEVQDSDADRFASKLRSVFRECNRILKNDGLLVFTYHHSRSEGWSALARAVLGAGFVVVNSHPVKSEMSVATPKAQAKDPIQVDVILVCRKAASAAAMPPISSHAAVNAAKAKLSRLEVAGFTLSRNDRKVTVIGQLLACLRDEHAIEGIDVVAERELKDSEAPDAHSAVAA